MEPLEQLVLKAAALRHGKNQVVSISSLLIRRKFHTKKGPTCKERMVTGRVKILHQRDLKDEVRDLHISEMSWTIFMKRPRKKANCE
jgi:hypothetical protein